MFNDNSIQGVILDTLAKEGRTCRLFTTNGFQINCKVLAADQYTVFVEDIKTGKQNLVYKHALSTVELPLERTFAFTKEETK